jgi:hypothetical protein
VIVLAPVSRLDPFTVKTAVALEPEAVSVFEPSEVFPKVKAMLPVGAALPDAGVSVAVSWVAALEAMLAGLAATARVVATGAPVMVSVTEPVEPLNGELPEYVATIVFALKARSVPASARVAVAAPLRLPRVAEPTALPPTVKVTVPVGAAAPCAGVTVATS